MKSEKECMECMVVKKIETRLIIGDCNRNDSMLGNGRK